MILTSSEFDVSVIANIRKWDSKIKVTFSDPIIDPTIDSTSTNLNRHSYPSQTYDQIESPTHKWAHLDGTCACDAGYYVCPEPSEIATNQMGWWSLRSCDSSGIFDPPVELVTTFNEKSISSVTISGDSFYDEFPGGSNEIAGKIYALLDDTTVSEGIFRQHSVTEGHYFEGLKVVNANKIVLQINLWNKPNRVAKIVEFFGGISTEFNGNQIQSFDLLEESEINGSIPIGNITANEFDLSLQNINMFVYISPLYRYLADPFSYGNTNSPYNNLLLKNRVIKPEIGLYTDATTVEYIPLGTFWSGDWDNKEQGTVVSTSCRDRLGLLQEANYVKSGVYTNVTATTLLTTVLDSAKYDIPMTDMSYNISSDFDSFTIEKAYFPKQSYFKCLKEIMEVARGRCYMSRNDVLICEGADD